MASIVQNMGIAESSAAGDPINNGVTNSASFLTRIRDWFYSARTGNVSPSTLQDMKDQQAADIRRAIGGTLPQDSVDAAVKASFDEIDRHLSNMVVMGTKNANPNTSDTSVRVGTYTLTPDGIKNGNGDPVIGWKQLGAIALAGFAAIVLLPLVRR